MILHAGGQVVGAGGESTETEHPDQRGGGPPARTSSPLPLPPGAVRDSQEALYGNAVH